MHTPAEQQTQGEANAGATFHSGPVGGATNTRGSNKHKGEPMLEPSPTQGQMFYSFTQTVKQPVATAFPPGSRSPSALLDTQKGHGKDSSQEYTVPGSPV